MDDFVMGERQDEVLGERIKKTKGQLVVVIVAVDRVTSPSTEIKPLSSITN